MQDTVYLDTGEEIKIHKNLYKGSGGEGTTYIVNDKCIKIYHDPAKCIPNGKIKELSKISRPEVIKPTGLVLSATSEPIGIVAQAVQGDYLCRYFSQNYQHEQNTSREDILGMVKTMQEVLKHIHKEGILVVDYNEMNFLVGKDFTPYHIDVDAYQTPTYKATAIMDSIRDPLVQKNEFDEGSDWFSFAVIACQLYIGSHPFKVRHATLGKNWQTFMQKGISVFDPSVRMPPNTLPPSSIPKGHRTWMEGVFKHASREAPPLPDALPVLPAPKQTIIVGTQTVEISKVFTQEEKITDAVELKGIWYTTSNTALFINGIKKLQFPKSKNVKILQQRGEVFVATDEKLLALNGWETNIGKSFLCGNRLFCINNANLLEIGIHKFSDKYTCSKKPVSTIFHNHNAADEVIIQDIIGSFRLLMPAISGGTLHIKELDNSRTLATAGSGNCAIIHYEKAGLFYIAIIFLGMDSYTIYTEEIDIQEPPLLVRMDKGIYVSSIGDQLWLFKDTSSIKKVNESPLCPGSKLKTFCDKIYAIMGKDIHQLRLK